MPQLNPIGQVWRENRFTDQRGFCVVTKSMFIAGYKETWPPWNVRFSNISCWRYRIVVGSAIASCQGARPLYYWYLLKCDQLNHFFLINNSLRIKFSPGQRFCKDCDDTYWASSRSTSEFCVLELTAMLCNVVYRAVSQTPQSWLTWKSRVLQNCPDPARQAVALQPYRTLLGRGD